MSTLTKVLISAAITAGAAYLLSRNNKTVSVKPEISTSGVKAKFVVDDEVTEVTYKSIRRNRTITIFGESDVKVSEKALKQILWQFGIECHGYVPVRKNVYSMAV